MIRNFFRKTICILIISCISFSLFSCGYRSKVPNTGAQDEVPNQTLDSQLIIDDVVAKSSTPDDNIEDSNYSEKILSTSGITLHIPEEYVNTDGIILYNDYDISSGSGVYYASASYIGMPEEEYYARTESEKEEDYAYVVSHSAPIFIILGIDDGRSLSDLLEFFNNTIDSSEKILETQMTKLTEVDGCSFYSYESGTDYSDRFEGEFADEYNIVMSLVGDLIRNSTFIAPTRPFADLIGTKLSFSTTDINGNAITSEELFAQNEVTMLNIWATWCGYCIEEFPSLAEINERLEEKNCAIVGLLGDGIDEETIEHGKALLEDGGISYLNILPWDGWDETLSISGWPTSFFVDRAGYIVGIPVQGAKVDLYEPRIEDILAGNTGFSPLEDEVEDMSMNAYKIYVVDKNSEPIPGVTVQFYDESTCKMAVTGETGMVSFNDPEGIQYEIHILNVPEGYKKNTEVYHTETYYSDLNIVLEKE